MAPINPMELRMIGPKNPGSRYTTGTPRIGSQPSGFNAMSTLTGMDRGAAAAGGCAGAHGNGA